MLIPRIGEDGLTPEEVIDQKLTDAETPGYEVFFEPDEAEKIAFH
jgi:hypothetical protein